jgi:hypothetical protein
MKQPDKTEHLYRLARLLDQKYRIPGTGVRFGLDPILGLIPGAGDWIGGVISSYFVLYALLLDAKASVLGRMFINILLDILIGSIPVLGEVFDVYWKANLRNARLLDDFVNDPQKTETQSQWFNWILFIMFVLIIVGLMLAISWMMIEIVDWVISLGS